MWTVLGSVSDLRVFHAVRLWDVFRMKFFWVMLSLFSFSPSLCLLLWTMVRQSDWDTASFLLYESCIHTINRKPLEVKWILQAVAFSSFQSKDLIPQKKSYIHKAWSNLKMFRLLFLSSAVPKPPCWLASDNSVLDSISIKMNLPLAFSIMEIF